MTPSIDLDFIVGMTKWNPKSLSNEGMLPSVLPREVPDERLHQRLLLEQFAGDDWNQPEGTVTGIARIERQSRLPEGEYEVRIHPHSFDGYTRRIELPGSQVNVRHERTHHAHAEFDPEFLLDPDTEGGRFEMDESELGRISKLVNIEYETSQFCTAYSRFAINVPEPEGWNDLLARLEEAEESIQPKNQRIHEAWVDVHEGRARRADALALTRKLRGEAIDEHGPLFDEFLEASGNITYPMNRSVWSIKQAYADATNSMVRGTRFRNGGMVIFDSDKRLVQSSTVQTDPSVMLPIGRYSVEALPFNDQFKERVQEFLSEGYPYDAVSETLRGQFMRADMLQQEGHAGSSIVMAASALEKTLKHFAREHGVISEKEASKGLYRRDGKTYRLTINRLLGPVFDDAVRRKEGWNGNGYFSGELRGRIHRLPRNSQIQQPTIQEIRNDIAHNRLGPSGNVASSGEAQMAVRTYADAACYVLSEGWKNGFSATSGAIGWAHGENLTFAPPVPEAQALRQMRSGLKQAWGYLQPQEREYLAETVRLNSWAYETVRSLSQE